MALLYIFDPALAGAAWRGWVPILGGAGFEPGTFRFLLQRLNPLGHYSRVPFGHQDKNFASKAKFQVKPK